MSTVADAIALAEIAQQMAGNAMVTATAQGIMFECLISTLGQSGVIGPDHVKSVFFTAAAIIDDASPTNDLERSSNVAMRETIERVASGFGLNVPPPGQTGVQRTH